MGNVILSSRGVGATMMTMVKKGLMSNLRSKIGALLVMALKSLKSFDASQYAAHRSWKPKGLVVKTHGSSRRKRSRTRSSIVSL
ncbi:MAG: hypothetical protein ACLTFJ_14050 [Clostridium sp.]